MFRLHCHSGIPAAAESFRTHRVFLPRCARDISDHPASSGQTHPGIPGMGGGLRPQSQGSHYESGEGRKQRGGRPASSTAHGTSEPARGILHHPEHGDGQDVLLAPAEISYRRPGLSHHPVAAIPPPALLLLHPRSSARPTGHVRQYLPPVSEHLLPERPPFHRDRTETPSSDASTT